MNSASKVFSKATGTQSIYRCLTILKTVAKYNESGVRLSQLSREVGLHTATVHRILSILLEEGWVIINPDTKTYHLGFELFALGKAAYQFNLRDVLHGALERIGHQTEDATYLVIQSGYDAICLDRVVGKFPIQVLTFEIGERRPMGIGAGSLTLLSSLSNPQIDTIINSNAKRYEAFHRTVEDVKASVSHCRRVGYGLSVKTVSPDTIGVGLLIENSEGKGIAAISVAGIAKRMGPKRREAIVRLIKAEIAAVDKRYLKSLKL